LSLLIALVVVMLGNSVPIVLFPALFLELGLSPTTMGMVLAFNGLVTALAAPIGGARSSVHGRKILVLIGMAGFTLSILLLAAILGGGLRGWLPTGILVAGMFVSWGFYGCSVAASQPATFAYFADTSDQKARTKSMALIGLALGTGAAIGPGLTGGLAAFGLLLPMVVVAALGVLSMGPVWRYVDPTVGRHQASSTISIIKVTDRRIFPFLLLIFVLFAVFIGVGVIAGFYFRGLFGYQGRELAMMTGVFLTIMSVATLISQGLIFRFSFSPGWLIKSGFPILATSLLVLGLATTVPGVAIAFGLLGIAMAMVLTGCNSGATLNVEKHEFGATSGLLIAAPQAGIIVGPLLSTFLFERSATLPILTLAAVAGFAGIYAFFNISVRSGQTAELEKASD
jgi:MFS family permease